MAYRRTMMRSDELFDALLARAVAASVVFHIFIVIAIVFAPESSPPAENQVILAEMVDFPKGPGLGPHAPTKKITGLKKPDPPGKQKQPEKLKPGELAAPEQVKTKTRNMANKDQENYDPIAKLRAEHEKQASGGGGTSDQDGGTGIWGVYLNRVRQKIYTAWVVPGGIPPQYQSKSVIVGIKISAFGQVSAKWVATSSGYAALDNSALAAIEKAAPVPDPPPAMAPKLSTEGMMVVFNPRRKGLN